MACFLGWSKMAAGPRRGRAEPQRDAAEHAGPGNDGMVVDFGRVLLGGVRGRLNELGDDHGDARHVCRYQTGSLASTAAGSQSELARSHVSGWVDAREARVLDEGWGWASRAGGGRSRSLFGVWHALQRRKTQTAGISTSDLGLAQSGVASTGASSRKPSWVSRSRARLR